MVKFQYIFRIETRLLCSISEIIGTSSYNAYGYNLKGKIPENRNP